MHKKLTTSTLLASTCITISALFAPVASAHVVVSPRETLTATYQTFTVSVPNERDTSTTALRIAVPKEIASVTPTALTGWHITTTKSDDRISEIRWSGGEIPVGQRIDFSFSARTPDNATELQWKAYQTYADGTVVAWDQPASAQKSHTDDTTNGPLSVTSVTAETATNTALAKAADDAARAESAARQAKAVAVAAIAVALISLFLYSKRTRVKK